jgi:hypothetical protein
MCEKIANLLTLLARRNEEISKTRNGIRDEAVRVGYGLEPNVAPPPVFPFIMNAVNPGKYNRKTGIGDPMRNKTTQPKCQDWKRDEN